MTAALLVFLFASAHAGPTIYACTDASGARQTSDRPIQNCAVLLEKNPDGTTKGVVHTLTDEERALAADQERERILEQQAEKARIRNEANLLRRFPNEAAHGRARQAGLDTVRASMRAQAARMRDLEAERKHLADEEQFYPGRSLPSALRSAIDANEAAQAAQRQAALTTRGELDRVNALFDAELATLRRLWAR